MDVGGGAGGPGRVGREPTGAAAPRPLEGARRRRGTPRGGGVMSWFRRRTDVSCQELVELLTDYLETALPKRQQRAVAAHLGECGNCAAYLDQFRATIALTGELREEDVPPEAMEELLAVFRDWKG